MLLPTDGQEPFDLAQYISALFFAPAGYYRMIGRVVTDRPIVAATTILDGSTASRLPGSGTTSLPLSFSVRAFGPNHHVFALIYEFRKSAPGRDVKELSPARLPACAHLLRLGLEQALAVC